MDHRESARVVSAEGRPREPRDEPGRHGPRFARFVSSPIERRFVLSRLGLAVVSGTVALIVVVIGGTRLVSSLVRWLHGQPQYQTTFSALTLDPPPPAWYRGGSAGFLEGVCQNVHRENRAFSALDVDLAALHREFRLYCWVKGVRLERQFPNKIIAHLEYRTPVARLPLPGKPRMTLLDEEGEFLPWDDVDEEMAQRLVRIQLVPPLESTPADERTLAAVKLAAFLRSALARVDTPPRFLQPRVIHHTQKDGLFIENAEVSLIYWGEAPGAERPPALSAAEKWEMLLRWLPHRPSEPVQHPQFITFTKDGVIVAGEAAGLN